LLELRVADFASEFFHSAPKPGSDEAIPVGIP